MKKSLFKNICLSLACLLGIGGLIGVALSSPKEATQVSAASTYYTEKKTYLYLFNPETNKGATTFQEVNNTGTWKVSPRGADDAASNYSLWRDIPSSQTITFTRNQSLKHIYEIDIYIQQFYGKVDKNWHPVKGTLKIGGSVVSTAQSDGSESSSSIFKNKLAYKGDEKDGAVSLDLNAVNSSSYSFYFNEIFIYYREYSAINVTLNHNGGTSTQNSVACTYGEAMPASVKIPTRHGYRFDGYYVGTKQYYKADGTKAVDKFDINAESATFTAKWTLMEFDITLNDNEGTGGQGSIKAIKDDPMPNLTTLPTRTGYTFQGYFDAKSGGTQYFAADGKGIGKYNLTKATTVYARWEANKYDISFNPTQGNGGITDLEATYDSPLRDLTSEEIPTREPEHGHSYSFGGYYTEAPTEDENGYQTPHGKCYINDLGKGSLWKEASDTTLYAYWTVDMTVSSSGYEGTWDNQYHGISVNVQSPEETTIYYGNQEGKCSDTNPEHFLKSNAGTYTIYFEVRKDSYTTFRHSETIVINKAESVIEEAPTAVEELEYIGENQQLVNAGTADYGKMLYALSDTKISDEETLSSLTFTEEIPTAKNVGTYYVYYKTSGDSNHNEYKELLTNYVEVSIAEVDKTVLKNTVDKAREYLLTIVDDYQDIANELSEKISIAQGEFVDNKNVTAQQVENAANDLESYISNAKVAVTETKINAIGDLSYPDSQALIDEARDYYNNVLNDSERNAVDPTLSSLLDNDYNVYYGAKQLADLINAIPEPSDSKAYFDAVDAAKALYDELQENNPEAVNLLFGSTEANYQKIFEDNVAAKDVIKKIQDIGEVTYECGESDSGAAIIVANAGYLHLTDDQQAIVKGVNYDELTHKETVYGHVNDVAILINAIPEASESSDYYDAVDDAKAAYSALTEEEQAIINATVIKDFDKILNDQVAARGVIELIQNIGEVTYNGGENDSSAAIIAAEFGYQFLEDDQKAIVNGVNYDDLDTKSTVYGHINDVAKLIEAIPEASDTQAYYDAVKAANDAYNLLSDEEQAIINAATNINYEKVLEDNVKASEVIKEIQAIGEVTYNKGENDSLAAIESAETNYANLTEDQKALVDTANKSDLDYDRSVYDNVDATVDLINAIGEVSHTEDKDSKEALIAARTAYDALNEEEKALVKGYNDSYQTLVDDEAVYEVMVKIDAIGEVSYDTRSEDAINEAREVYNSLTKEQQDQLGDAYSNILTTAETKYSELKKTADIWVIILLIIASLLVVGAIWLLIVLLKKKKNNDDDQNGNSGNSKKEPVKAMSIGGLLPLAILTSNYLSGPWIALYAIAGVAVLLWISILVIVIMKKKQVGPFKKKDEVTKVEPQATTQNEDEEESVTITDEAGNVFNIKFVKSFTAKLIQAPEETKKYYEELKNEVLSYKKTNSRISWHFDSINSGRSYVLKFAIRGKTLCVYLPLNADDYADSKYKVEKVESKKFEDVPCLYRIKNDRRLGYAKELIAVVAHNLGLEKGEEQHEVYSNLPYEPNKPLIERGLIKELKVQVNKPQEEVLASKINSDGDEVITTKDSKGNIFEIRYIKSFTAKLSQAEDVTKDYYHILKNYVLSYKKTNSRVSWHYDSINVGREQILKFAIRGKTLCLYYALDASALDDKYKVEEAKGKKFIDVPCLYRIKNDRRCEYAKELIDLLMEKLGVEKGKELNDEYRIPFEDNKTLLAKGLIKEVKRKVTNKEEVIKAISVVEADEKMSDEEAEKEIKEDLTSKEHKGKKGIINIDTIGENFNDGDVVTIEALWEKKLIPHNVGYVKVLARGTLSKKLTLDLQDYSIQAVKMVLLEGGTVKKAK